MEVDGVQMHILPVTSEHGTGGPDEGERRHHSPDDILAIHAQHRSGKNVSSQVAQGPRLKNAINRFCNQAYLRSSKIALLC